ncbi:MAG: hypothetical protein ACI8XC_002331 [Gammaproteobacteria bacterium]|jgi:hypothetical protein
MQGIRFLLQLFESFRFDRLGRLGFFLFVGLFLIACGGGGKKTTPPASGKTITVFATKGPLHNASCTLYTSNHEQVAGPIESDQGNVQFDNVTYTGEVYSACSGGEYQDEATGETVQLNDNQILRSAIIELADNTNDVQQSITPLTEIAFARTESAGNLNANQFALELNKLADQFGLDGIDLGLVQPVALDEITGDDSPGERYGTVLAAVSQMLLDARIGDAEPTGNELVDLLSNIGNNELNLNDYRQALNNLESNIFTAAIGTTIDLQGNSGEVASDPGQATGSIRVRLVQQNQLKSNIKNREADVQLFDLNAIVNSLETAVEDGNKENVTQTLEQSDSSILIHDIPVTNNASVVIVDEDTETGATQSEITVQPNEITEVELNLSPTHDLSFNVQSGSLESVIVDINALELRNELFATNEGHIIKGLPEGHHFVTFSDTNGLVLQSRYIQIPIHTETLSITLDTQSNNLRGRLLDVNGNPVIDALLIIKPDSETFNITQSIDTGQFNFDSLATGNYTLIINKSGFNPHQELNIAIEAGANTLDDITLNEALTTGSIAGYAYYNDTQLHNGIDITLERVDGSAGTQQFGSLNDGAFLVDQLEPGQYNLLFGKGGDTSYSTITLTELEVIAGVTRIIEAPVVLQHQIGQISGNLTIPSDFGSTSNLKLEVLDSSQQVINSFAIENANVNLYQVTQIPVGTGYSVRLSGSNSDGIAIEEQVSNTFDVVANDDLQIENLSALLLVGQISGNLTIPIDFGSTSNLALEVLDNSQQVVKTFVIESALVTQYQITQIPVGSGYSVRLSGSNSDGIAIEEQVSSVFDIIAGDDLQDIDLSIILLVGSISGSLQLPLGFGDLSNLSFIIRNSQGVETNRQVIGTNFTLNTIPPGNNYSLSLGGSNFKGTAIKPVMLAGLNISLSQTTIIADAFIVELQLATTGGDNQKPEIQHVTPDVTLAPSVTLNYLVQDPEGDAISCRIDWGDNLIAEVIDSCYNSSILHLYAQTGDYRIIFSASDASGSVIWDDIVSVIYYPFLTGLDIIEQTDRVIELKGGVQNSELLNIDWGDGADVETLDLNLDSFSVLHQYPVAGSYTLTLSNDGGDSVERSLLISENLAPIILFDDSSQLQFNNMTLFFSVSDAEDDAFTCIVDWGDNSQQDIALCSQESLSHSYATVGQYDIVISASDALQQSSQIIIPVTVTLLQQDTLSVDNLTITALSGKNARLTGSINVDAGFSRFSINWGDGQKADYSPASPVNFEDLSILKTYALEDLYLITLEIEDLQGNLSTAQSTVEIAENYAPEINLNASDIIRQDVTLDFSVTDRDQDAFSCNVNWGDGLTDPLADCGQVIISHHYAASSTAFYTIIINAVDINDNSRDLNLDADINVIPIITVNAIEGDNRSVNLAGLVEDVDGSIDSIVIDWGDGNIVSLVLPEIAQTQITLDESHQYDIDGVYSIVLSVTDNEAVKKIKAFEIEARIRGGTQAAITSDSMETGEVTLNFAVSPVDGSDTVYECLVVWGDGDHDSLNQCQSGSVSHSYHQGVATDYPIRFYISDDGGRHSIYQFDTAAQPWIKSFQTDALPEFHISALSLNQARQVVIQGYLLFADEALIDWGNSVTNTLQSGLFNIVSTIEYAGDGPFNLLVTASNNNGSEQTSFVTLFDLATTITGNHAIDPLDPMRLTSVVGENLQWSVPDAGFQYNWNFDNLAPENTTINPDPILFEQPGTYLITLTTIDDLGQHGSLQWQVDVESDVQPLIDEFDITGIDGNGDARTLNIFNEFEIWQGESLDFSALVTQGNAPLSYLWDFNGAAINTTQQDGGLVVFDNSGFFNVSFTVTDLDGETAQQNQIVYVKANTAGEKGSIFDRVRVEIYPITELGVAPDRARVYINDGNPLPAVAFFFPVDGILDAGQLQLYVRQTVAFSAPLEADIDALEYSWDYQGSNDANGNTLNLHYLVPGVFPVSLTVTYNDNSQETYELLIEAIEDIGLRVAPNIKVIQVIVPISPLETPQQKLVDAP